MYLGISGYRGSDHRPSIFLLILVNVIAPYFFFPKRSPMSFYYLQYFFTCTYMEAVSRNIGKVALCRKKVSKSKIADLNCPL